MILPDYRLRMWAKEGGLTPYDPSNVNPASVDLRFSGRMIDLAAGVGSVQSGRTKITLEPGDAILADTLEYIRMPDDCTGVIYLKSSLARAGLDHALAGWIDPGFEGTLTLELHAHRPITIREGQCIIQLVLQRMECRPENLYAGKYQGQRNPTMAR